MHVRSAPGLFVTAGIALAVLLVPARGLPCDCSGPHKPFEELVEAVQVFEAEVVAKRQSLRLDKCRYPVKMLRAWKGTTTEKDEPVYDSCFCSAPGLAVGRSYIFYTSKSYDDGPPNIHLCSRVVPSEDAALDPV